MALGFLPYTFTFDKLLATGTDKQVFGHDAAMR